MICYRPVVPKRLLSEPTHLGHPPAHTHAVSTPLLPLHTAAAPPQPVVTGDMTEQLTAE